ncbi:hypothetical protein EFQ99_13045 [Rhizobium vallis]|uniref:Uncharacterized protein n=1 Tax=Rhizobium vallis TaxID=634290 RepID=A0A432PMF4_9HYPH|nr:hypothetical protein EFQ99_13045 [Rhizobium vallis]
MPVGVVPKCLSAFDEGARGKFKLIRVRLRYPIHLPILAGISLKYIEGGVSHLYDLLFAAIRIERINYLPIVILIVRCFIGAVHNLARVIGWSIIWVRSAISSSHAERERDHAQ